MFPALLVPALFAGPGALVATIVALLSFAETMIQRLHIVPLGGHNAPQVIQDVGAAVAVNKEIPCHFSSVLSQTIN